MTIAMPPVDPGIWAAALEALATIQSKATPVPAYRDAMRHLGELLGQVLTQEAIGPNDSVCLAMTVEDADYLGLGALGALETAGVKVAVACLWNERGNAFDLDWADLAPVVQEYREPVPASVDHLVILKSVVSGTCVVRSNIEHLCDDIAPDRIHVVAPVMLEGADERLQKGFSDAWASRFEYWTFELDKERSPEGEVIPGIGGEIYERLGLGTKKTKNAIVPELVKMRGREAA